MAASIFSRLPAGRDGDDTARAERTSGHTALEESFTRWHEDLLALTSRDDAEAAPRLTLSQAHPGGLAQLHAEHPTRLANLVRDEAAHARALDRARSILARSRHLAERHGVGPVHLAIGQVAWTEADRRVASPAILRTVLLEEEDGDVVLCLRPGLQLPRALGRALAARGTRLDLAALNSAARTVHGFSQSRALAHMRDLVSVLDHADVHEELVVGIFEHPAAILLRDYDDTSQLSRSPLVRALAGDERAREALHEPLPEPDPADRDPWKERGVGDLSPREQDVIETVVQGRSLLVDTPHGADATALVAAILAEAGSHGLSTLHIGGTPSRTSRVEARLRDLGVEDVSVRIDGSGNAADELRGRLAAALADKGVAEDPAATEAMRRELTDVRATLSAYTTQLHEPFRQFGISAFDALQVLTDLTGTHPAPRTRVRLREDVLLDIASDQGERARTLLHRAAALDVFSRSTEYGAWAGVVINSADVVPDVMERLARLTKDTLPAMCAHVDAVAAETGITRALTLSQWESQLAMLEGVRDVLDVFRPAVFERSAADMVIATASPKWRKEHGVSMSRSQRNRLVKQARDLLRPGRHVDDLHLELLRVQEKREVWRRHGEAGGWPVLPSHLDDIIDLTKRVRLDIDRLAPMLATAQPDLGRLELSALARLLDRLAADPDGANDLPRRVAVLKDLSALGLDDLVMDLRRRHVEDDLLDAELDLAWWASVLGLMLASEARLGGCDPTHLESALERGRELDLTQVASLVPQALQNLHRHRLHALEAAPDARGDLEVALRGRASAVELCRRHPLTRALVPVWLTVPTLVPWLVPITQRVDLVVMEDVDDLPLAELVPILSRARQVVVVTDVTAAKEGGSVRALAEALPHLAMPVAPTHLNDQVARLLSHHGFGHAGVPVPWTGTADPIRAVWTTSSGMPAPGASAIESTVAEVRTVVDLVVRHAAEDPDHSLAVVALNERHAERIRAAVARTLSEEPGLASFFSPDEAEPFVVVDPLSARGVLRDHVIVAVGFSKTPHGRVLHDFGAFSRADGAELMADVLRTVRGDLTVVSSIRAGEIDRARLSSQGAQMLVDLLDMAEGEAEVDHSGWPVLDSEPDRLLIDIADRLYGMGLEVVPNVGVPGGMRIPLAIGHPEVPGRLLVAVLTDDDAYVGEPSQRVRDRVWPSLLEKQGWRVHTALSMAVFIDPNKETEEIVRVVLDAVDEARARGEVAVPHMPDHIDLDEDSTSELLALPVSSRPGEDEDPREVEERLAEQEREDRLREKADELATGMIALVERTAEAEAAAAEDAELLARRGPRPAVAKGLPLAAYGDDQLDELADWVRSDGVEREEEEMVEQLRLALGLTRRGAQSDAVLANVVRRTERRDD